MTHKIPSSPCETLSPGGGAEHSHLDRTRDLGQHKLDSQRTRAPRPFYELTVSSGLLPPPQLTGCQVVPLHLFYFTSSFSSL